MSHAVDRLTLIVAASYAGAVGFADVFDCKVKRVINGAMTDAGTRLFVLANDRENLTFISDHLDPAEIEIGFKIIPDVKLDDIPPASGFVDSTGTYWGVESIREAK